MEDALPPIVAILLGTFGLGVLVTVVFTAWRLVANLKTLMASLARLNAALAPALEELTRKGEEAAELAARIQDRQARRGPGKGAARATAPVGERGRRGR